MVVSTKQLFKCLALFLFSAQAVTAIGTPLTIGENEAFSINFQVGQQASKKDVINYPGARYISVHFDRFNLPQGDRVVVRSPDGSVRYEYTGLGRGDLGESGGFHSSPIRGETAIVEYISGSNKNNDVSNMSLGYTIDNYVRGITAKATRSICESDNSKPAICHAGSAMYEKSKAVVRLLIDGRSACTAWLVGSEGRLMTNNHCIKDEEKAKVVDVEFNAESESCEDLCEDWFGCSGTVVANETTFIATSTAFDYTLVQLPSSVQLPTTSFLQMRESGAIVGEQIYIPQHPKAWGKRIADVLDDGTPAIITATNVSTICSEKAVTYSADTQGGSSGSPVLSAKDNLVVAIHNCGDNCINGGLDVADVIADLKSHNIDLGDMVASVDPTSSAPTTPEPTPSPANDLFGHISNMIDSWLNSSR